MSAPLFSQRLVTAPQLGQPLRTQRESRKLTQSQIAQRVACSQNRVSWLEKHPEDLSFRQLLSWCAALGLELHLQLPDPAESKSISEW
ncbi:helix-turn-helix domain-containing protein [Caballeronia sp. NK8]|uniref:helix-turn-helix domain-containing protein n=1 Tax=Caballeronia sp. NK8 TaxID=140098 RepID=UPI001BCC2F78|nr:helix-turn-helix domain-containing protein [Caballeronia sp. NK8]